MARPGISEKSNVHSPARRRSVLDLAPLELDCMNGLWALGRGTVREIRARLATTRPRAYTTIMTIMDRLARKGIVERHKVGRAYLYLPNLTAEEARSKAVRQLVDGFFGGSMEDLQTQLRNPSATLVRARPLVRAAAAGAVGASPAEVANPSVGSAPNEREDTEASRMDDTLL